MQRNDMRLTTRQIVRKVGVKINGGRKTQNNMDNIRSIPIILAQSTYKVWRAPNVTENFGLFTQSLARLCEKSAKRLMVGEKYQKGQETKVCSHNYGQNDTLSVALSH